MEKTIRIGNEDIRFKATARTPLLYRTWLKRDIFKDIGKLQENYSKAQEKDAVDISDIETETINIIQQIAYVMAKQADASIKESYEEWVDGFDMFEIYPVMNEIIALWGMNMTQEAEAKKNKDRLTAR